MTSRQLALRNRLTIVVGIVVLGVSVAIAITVSISTRRALIDRVDEDLLVFADRTAAPLAAGIVPDDVREGFEPYAVIRVDRTGTVVASQPAGFEDNPEPLPEITGMNLKSLVPGSFLTLDTVGGAGSARVLVHETSSGWDLIAASLDSVDATSQQVVVIALIASVLAAVTGVAVSSWLVRTSLRPVDDMIETASAIADGDLSQRTELVESDTELGRLSQALDHMLTRIEKADRDRLREAERLRRFADDAAHELRTPISAIAGYAELFNAGGIEPGPGLDRAMARITEAGERAGRLIEDLLALARLDREIGINRSPLDLTALVADTVEDARISTGRDIRRDTPRSVVVNGDRVWLRQAIENLIRNAVAHAPESEPIELVVDSVGAQARLRVVDHGPGIPEAERERVFDRFARPDSGRDRSQGGTGLGLAIVREVVLSHEGVVAILETSGGGATVQILLPLVPGPGVAS